MQGLPQGFQATWHKHWDCVYVTEGEWQMFFCMGGSYPVPVTRVRRNQVSWVSNVVTSYGHYLKQYKVWSALAITAPLYLDFVPDVYESVLYDKCFVC